jgi:hypothetical protein
MQKNLTHRIGRHKRASARFELVYGEEAAAERMPANRLRLTPPNFQASTQWPPVVFALT